MRRFIAGAVCPQCRAMDRIVVEELSHEGEGQTARRRRCVSCGYTDELVSGSATEPPRRFTRRSVREAPPAPVRIVDRVKRKP